MRRGFASLSQQGGGGDGANSNRGEELWRSSGVEREEFSLEKKGESFSLRHGENTHLLSISRGERRYLRRERREKTVPFLNSGKESGACHLLIEEE